MYLSKLKFTFALSLHLQLQQLVVARHKITWKYNRDFETNKSSVTYRIQTVDINVTLSYARFFCSWPACFHQYVRMLGIMCMFSRAWHWLNVYLLLVTVTCLSTFSIVAFVPDSFSFAWHQLRVFPRLELVLGTFFSRLSPVHVFPRLITITSPDA